MKQMSTTVLSRGLINANMAVLTINIYDVMLHKDAYSIKEEAALLQYLLR